MQDQASNSLLADIAVHNAVCASAAGSCAREVEGSHQSPCFDVDGKDMVVVIHICGIALLAMTGIE